MNIRMDITPPRVVLENEFLEIFFVADHGMELVFLKEKKTGQKLTGIKCKRKDTAFFAKVCDEKNYVFLRSYEFEEENGLLWQMDFHLPEGSRSLNVYVTLINDTPDEIQTRWIVDHIVSDDYKKYFPNTGNSWQAAINAEGKGFFVRTTLDAECGKILLKPGEVRTFSYHYGLLELDSEDMSAEEEKYVHACVKTAVNLMLSEQKMLENQNAYRKYRDCPCAKLLYTGSGWGALEQIRRMREERPLFPQQFLFPAESLGEEQKEELLKVIG